MPCRAVPVRSGGPMLCGPMLCRLRRAPRPGVGGCGESVSQSVRVSQVHEQLCGDLLAGDHPSLNLGMEQLRFGSERARA
jgi:hypothetical protein